MTEAPFTDRLSAVYLPFICRLFFADFQSDQRLAATMAFNRIKAEKTASYFSSYFSVTSPRPAILPVAVLPGGTNWQATMLPLDTNMPFFRVLP